MMNITCTVCGTAVMTQYGPPNVSDSKVDVQGLADIDRTGKWLIIPVVICPKCATDSIKRRIADALRLEKP